MRSPLKPQRIAAEWIGYWRGMTHVLIAVDDSDHAVDLARCALQLFGDEAKYTVLSVAHQRPLVWGDDMLVGGVVYPLAVPGMGVLGGVPLDVHAQGDLERPLVDPADVAVRNAEDVAATAGIDAEPVGLVGGDVAETILEAAAQHDADVIVVGSHARGWFSRLLTPSVADAVAKRAERPVLIANQRHDDTPQD
jgi:nucleotide-binding universal stress UspA family protein